MTWLCYVCCRVLSEENHTCYPINNHTKVNRLLVIVDHLLKEQDKLIQQRFEARKLANKFYRENQNITQELITADTKIEEQHKLLFSFNLFRLLGL